MSERETRTRAGFVQTEGAYILVEASTFRIGTLQTAEATATVRRSNDPDTPLGVEVWSVQITAPVEGELSECRRTDQCGCDASWPIDADSDDAMKDFDVTVLASSEGIGTLRATFTFKYGELSAPT